MHMSQKRPSFLTSGLYLGLIFISVYSITIFYYLEIILRMPKGLISFLINYSFPQQGSIITCSHVQICNLISKHKYYFTKIYLSVSHLCNQRSINRVSWCFLGSLHFQVKPYHYFIVTHFDINEKFKNNNYIDSFEDIFTQQAHSCLRGFSTQRIYQTHVQCVNGNISLKRIPLFETKEMKLSQLLCILH